MPRRSTRLLTATIALIGAFNFALADGQTTTDVGDFVSNFAQISHCDNATIAHGKS
jgi:hypothetical protein